MYKFFWKCIYAFNGTVLGRFLPGVIIANSKLYEDGDEYVKLRADGWVIVTSKSDPKCTDMLPITLVSEECIDILMKSRFKIKE